MTIETICLNGILYSLVFMIGACLGSFFNEFYFRYQPQLSTTRYLHHLIWRRSHCHSCRTPLPYRDLVPIFSWIAQHGQSRCCHQPLSRIYPVIEIGSGALAVILMSLFSFSPQAYLLLLLLLLYLPFIGIDIRYLLIPNLLPIVVAMIAVVNFSYQLFPISDVQIAFSMGMTFLFLNGPRLYYRYRYKKEGMGWGDIKLGVGLSTFLLPTMIPYFILLASMLGIVLYGLLRYVKHRNVTQIPFAPALLLAQWLLLYHQAIIMHFL